MCSDDGKVTPRYPAIVWGAAFLRSVFVAGISRAASGGYKVAAFGFHVRGVAAFRLSVAPRSDTRPARSRSLPAPGQPPAPCAANSVRLFWFGCLVSFFLWRGRLPKTLLLVAVTSRFAIPSVQAKPKTKTKTKTKNLRVDVSGDIVGAPALRLRGWDILRRR